MEKIIKPLVFLVIMILLCSVIVRVTSGSETLSDYAAKNPELAYATPEKQPENTPDLQTDASPSPADVPGHPAPSVGQEQDVESSPTAASPAKAPFMPLAQKTVHITPMGSSTNL